MSVYNPLFELSNLGKPFDKSIVLHDTLNSVVVGLYVNRGIPPKLNISKSAFEAFTLLFNQNHPETE